MAHSKICLIGEIVVDVSNSSITTKLRLGGITHAARALWALGIDYDIAYFCPEYLDDLAHKYLTKHGANNLFKIGTVSGAPYVFLITEEKETGDQGYEFLLRDEINIEYDSEIFTDWNNHSYENILAITGNYELNQVLQQIPEGKISLDIANNINELSELLDLKSKFENIFISTSSNIFQEYFQGSFPEFCDLFKSFTNRIILKENRGGTRGFDFSIEKFFSCGSQTQPIDHSVGVGDVFDATFLAFQNSHDLTETLSISSWVALEYALTKYPDDFKRNTERVINSDISSIKDLPSISLPWEDRNKHQIYIAAPDFKDVNTTKVDELSDALSYHNFVPKRPVKLFGEMEQAATKERQMELYNKDIALLNECSIIIGILLFNDPGTLIEIGIGNGKGIPTLVWDPYRIANNCMLTGSPDLLSSDLDEIISETFIQISNL